MRIPHTRLILCTALLAATALTCPAVADMQTTTTEDTAAMATASTVTSTALLLTVAEYSALNGNTGKPSVTTFMQAAGTDSTTASGILYGVVGAQPDLRNWSAIMASGNPLAAAKQATALQLRATGAVATFIADKLSNQGYTKTDASSIVASSGNFAVLKNANGSYSLAILGNDGYQRTSMDLNAASIKSMADIYGLKLSDLATLADKLDTTKTAALTDVKTTLQQASGVTTTTKTETDKDTDTTATKKSKDVAEVEGEPVKTGKASCVKFECNGGLTCGGTPECPSSWTFEGKATAYNYCALPSIMANYKDEGSKLSYECVTEANKVFRDTSIEAIGMDTSSAAIVSNLYKEELGRDVDEAGLAYFANQLQTGGKTIEQIRSDLHYCVQTKGAGKC